MKIGIIGGHDIVVSFGRTPENVADAARKIGGGTKAGTLEQAAHHGDVVIVATPWAVTLETIQKIASKLEGKTVWDTTNPFKTDMSGLDRPLDLCRRGNRQGRSRGKSRQGRSAIRGSASLAFYSPWRRAA
jgi:predicted dinucleotide-binding enzyme